MGVQTAGHARGREVEFGSTARIVNDYTEDDCLSVCYIINTLTNSKRSRLGKKLDSCVMATLSRHWPRSCVADIWKTGICTLFQQRLNHFITAAYHTGVLLLMSLDPNVPSLSGRRSVCIPRLPDTAHDNGVCPFLSTGISSTPLANNCITNCSQPADLVNKSGL